jgi:hypothetical protein
LPELSLSKISASRLRLAPSIADISAQIFRVSQKLSILRQLIKPSAEEAVRRDVETDKKVAELFQASNG